ncbi:MAG: ATP-binding cassette domain-containing protein [Proteobacteria bacterium]|nr:ATP-binding cassette domain-containing protein [Pseudomonadota bacterium]
MILYRLNRTTKTFQNRTVLDIDRLEIEQGLIYALFGPNGAGKTTLLHILGFLDKPTSGTVFFDNAPVDYSEKYLQKLRKNVVVVNQRPVLFTTSVYKNMEFGLRIRRISPKNRLRIVEESLDLVGMRHMIQAPAHKLSGGETQRVVLARALALSPRVILCDEPTSSVDLENQTAIIDLLGRINAEKKISIVFSSHDRSQTASISHHELFIDRGSLAVGSYENMFSVETTQRSDGRTVCSVAGSVEIGLPDDVQGKRRILLDPRKIDLIPAPGEHGQGAVLEGEVIQVSREKEEVRVVVDSQIRLAVVMPRDRYYSIQPMVGRTVSLLIRSDAVLVL